MEKIDTGHIIAHSGFALASLSFAISCSPWFMYASQTLMTVTGGGEWLPFYSIFWFIITILLLHDLFKRRTGWGIPLFIGMVFVLGLARLAGWAFEGFYSDDWLSFLMYCGFAVGILGKHLKVAYLLDAWAVLNRTTSSLKVIKDDE